MIREFNRQKVKERGDIFEVDEDLLHSIFNDMKHYDHILDKKKRIIKKATCILASITFSQPFGDGNKETALSTTTLFLRRNGFDLPLYTTAEKNAVYSLLEKTSLKPALDPSIDNEVEGFLEKTILLRIDHP